MGEAATIGRLRRRLAGTRRRMTTLWRRTSLRLRLVGLTVGLFVAFVWSLVFVSASLLETHLEALLTDQQAAATVQLTQQLEQKLKDNFDGLERAAAGLPREFSHALLEPLLAQRPLMHVAFTGGLMAIGIDGRVVADYPVLGRHGADYADRDWFRAAAAGRPTIGRPAVDALLRRPLLTLAVPVFDAAGRVRGVLSGAIDLAAPNFLSFITDPALAGESEYYVVSRRDGMFITATDPERILTPTPTRGSNLLFDRMMDGFAGSGIAVSSRGIRKLYSGRHVPRGDWLVIAAMPTDTAFAPMRTMLRYLYAIAVALTVLAAAAIGFSVRRMLAPLETAASAMERMTDRQQELTPLPIRSDDEIGTLVRNFNQLVVGRLEYETALTESEQRFRRLVEGVPDGIFVQVRGRFAYANPAALDLFGAAHAAALLGRPVFDRIHPDYRVAVAERIRLSNEDYQECPPLEEVYLKLDGTPVTVEVSAIPYHYGEDHGAIVFVRDIGERKRAAAEIDRHRNHLEELVAERTRQLAKATQAAEEATRAKSGFLATMSHEIRTPLGIIVGLGNVLRQKLQEPALRKRVEQLCATADHLSALVSDILDLSKIDAGHLALEESDFRLGDVLEKVTRLSAELAAERGLRFDVEATPELRAMPLRGDALRLTQVLINLAGNAVKFTEHGGLVLGVTALESLPAAARLRFTVRDTGAGIALADRERIFRAFEQGDAVAASERGGTGLGLSIAQRLVALMGGGIRLDSEVGVGSTFSFDLTFARGAGLAAPNSPEPPLPHFEGARVLVVDDHPFNQEILLDLLEAIGCEGEIASDGVEAVECARRATYDAILMDVRMPRMDGLAATRAIRALPEHRDTPILAVTANAFAEDRRQCLAAGMNGYVGKPFSLQSIAAALRQWLPCRETGGRNALPGDATLDRVFASIAGLDTTSLFRATAKNAAGYAALLRRYVGMHENDMEILRGHLAAGERAAARAVAHQLKGVSRLIGASAVAASAAEIEAALRDGEGDGAAAAPLARCAEEFAALAAALRALPAETLA